jgi:hypothetical protein
MPDLLSTEWLELIAAEGAGLPERPGASGHLRYVIGDGKRDEVSYDVVFRDGRIVSVAHDGSGEPDVVRNATRPVLASVAAGEVGTPAALMRGKLKASTTGPLLRLLPVFQSAEWREVEWAIAAQTTT